MKLELKNVKTSRFASHETECFEASIYCDGKRAGKVCNNGHGGPNFYDWKSKRLGRQIETWAAEQDLPYAFEKLDQVIDRLLAEAVVRKQIKNFCRRKTLFRVAGDTGEGWRTISRKFDPEVKAHLVAKYGDKLGEIANETY